MTSKNRRRQKTPKDLKLTEHCIKCKNQLPKNSNHHYLCHKCWVEKQLAKGNLALIGGVK